MEFSAKLQWITPKTEEQIMYIARVSNPTMQSCGNAKLLSYCLKHGHVSIFQMANLCVEIETSRAISAQIIRHQSFHFQEFSQRYAKVQEIIIYEARRQDQKNRQNSIDDMSAEDKNWFMRAQKNHAANATELYNEALDRGIAKEQARFLLPMASKTRIYMNGTIRSWIFFLKVRTHIATQKEHRVIADAIKVIFKKEMPTIFKGAFEV